MSSEKALALIKKTSWFKNCSDEFQAALADKVEFVDADEGHVFVREDDIVDKFMILESGILGRTKLSADPSVKASLRDMKQADISGTLTEKGVLVDTIEGEATITGLLHCMSDVESSYATVTARGGPAKVWIMPAAEFRTLVASKPEFMFDVMAAMANEVRSGSKSLRSVMKKLRTGGGGDDDADGKDVLRVLCYDTTSWVSDVFKPAIDKFNASDKEAFHIVMDFTGERLGQYSATYAAGYDAVCTFVNDVADAETMQTLSRLGVKMIAQRAAGFDRIDTKAARAYGMTVARVPAYSPYAVAEHAVSLLMAVNRKTPKANNRIKMANFTLDGGLMGMDIHGKTIGVMGTGKIGQILCNIMIGFGVKLICYDVFQSEDVKKAGGVYVSQDEIYAQSDVIFLMMPLLPATKHTINDSVLPKLKKGVIIINTSRGGLVNTKSVLKGLQSGVISGVGIDVYENEADYFFQDWSAKHIEDPDLLALLGEPGVVMTAHQAFFTKEAVDKICSTTMENLMNFKKGQTGYSHPNNCIPADKN